MLADHGRVLWPEAFRAARRLRYQTYHQLGWLDANRQDADGGEHDRWDKEAVHFGVLRRTSTVELIATSRLIIKQNSATLLPVELDYPEAFPYAPAAVFDGELSRLISISSDRRERALASLACQRAMLGWGLANGVGQSYAIVEDYLIRRLEATGIPHKRLTALKPLPQFGDTQNCAIRVDPHAMVGQLRRPGTVPVSTWLFFRGLARHHGRGLAGRSFLLLPHGRTPSRTRL